MQPTPLYQRLAGLIGARENCRKAQPPNQEWFERHTDRTKALVKEHGPSGGGFDNGTTIDLERSTPEKLVFHTSFHHLNDVGYYDGWTDHDVIVTPSLIHGFTLRITGRDRRQIKEHIHQTFHEVLSTLVEE